MSFGLELFLCLKKKYSNETKKGFADVDVHEKKEQLSIIQVFETMYYVSRTIDLLYVVDCELKMEQITTGM